MAAFIWDGVFIGIMDLVPYLHTFALIPTNHNTSLAMKDIRISDHANWRHVHWNALLSQS